jgi:hypothetical protein
MSSGLTLRTTSSRSRLFEGYLELESHVKVIFDGSLVPSGDEDHLAHARGVGFLDGVLDQWLVDHRKHLLGLCLGGRQETRAQPGDGEDGFLDLHVRAYGA